MIYNCNIEQIDDKYVVVFPDLPNVKTFGSSIEEAQIMAKEALEGVLEVDLDFMLNIPDPEFKGGYPIEINPRIAFAINLRKARGARTQQEVASALGMTYQQYQRLENPKKTNPTISTIYKLEKTLGCRFLNC